MTCPIPRAGAMLAALALLLAAPAGASTGFGDFTKRIEPGGFDEQCFELARDQSASWRFDASAPVDFNLHWHRGSDVFYPVRRRAVRKDAGSYVAAHADGYCLMWVNKGAAAVEVRGHVTRP